jgi:hypothetical protein
MRARHLALSSCLFTTAAALAVACGSGDDDNGGATIPSGGSGGAAAASGSSGGGSGNAGGSFGGGFPGGGDGNSGGSGGSAGEPNCGGETLASKTKPVNILIVMDKSGSMNEELEGTVSRWGGVKLALGTALNATQADIAFGLSLFPYDPADPTGNITCTMPSSAEPVVAVTSTDARTAILGALEATEPGGGTPTAEALRLALEYFTAGTGATLEGDNYVLLATDGGPNCNADHPGCDAATCTQNIDGLCPPPPIGPETHCCDNNLVEDCLDDAASVAAVAALASAGIETFVVGIPGTDAYESTLNAMAEAGGHPQSGTVKYFSVSEAGGVDALAETFERITKDLVTKCEQQLTEPPPRGRVDLINVKIDDEVIYLLEEDQEGDGWKYDENTSPPTVTIVGAPCTRIETEGVEKLEFIFGCPRVEPPR